MRNRLTQLTLVLIVIIALPVALFFARSISELSDNEKMLHKVFDKQLQSILYSLNQHTEVLFGLWSARLDMAWQVDTQKVTEVVEELRWKNPSIIALSFSEVDQDKKLFSSGDFSHPVVSLLRPDPAMLVKLKEHIGSGYQQVASAGNEKGTLLYFLLSGDAKNMVCQIWIDPTLFIESNLSLIIQQVSPDLFDVSVAYENQSQAIPDDSLKSDMEWTVSQSSWYLPGYRFQIRPTNKTIEDLVSERTQKNYLLLSITLMVVLIGGGFLIFAVRREMHLAALKAEFVSNVSHELRTPLALMNMYTETLLLKRLKDKNREEEYLNVIHRETKRLSDMVNRILNFSKMERGQRKYKMIECSVNQLIIDAITLFKPNFEKNKVNISYLVLPDDQYIMADREAIIEVLVNLLDNAINYNNADQKTIVVRAKVKAGAVLVEVEDNGIGIPAGELGKIFDKFYRITKGDLANEVKGSGLGLNIVYQIMKFHKGKVSVESQPGKGSCFIMHFPLLANK